MTEIAKLSAKLEADTRQFDQSMKGSNKHMEDAKKLVEEWSDSYEEAANDIDKYVAKLEKRIQELEKENEKAVKSMEKANDRLKDNIDENAEYIQKRYGDVGYSSEQAAKKVTDFSRILKWSLYFASGGLAGLTSIAIIKQQAFELNRELDETTKLMRQIAGSQGEHVAEHIFNVRTPFSRDALTASAYQQLASNVAPAEIRKNLSLYADATVGLGGDDAMFQGLSDAMTLLGNTGTEVQGYQQLAGLGVDVDKYVSPLGGGSSIRALQDVERGALATEEIVKAVITGLNNDFLGLVETQEETFSSAVQSISQFFEQTAMRFGKSWYERIKKSAQDISKFLWSDEWGEKVEKMFTSVNMVLDQFASRAAEVGNALKPFVMSLGDVVASGTELGATFLKAVEPLVTVQVKMLSFAGTTAAKVGNAVAGLIQKFKVFAEVVALAFAARTFGKFGMFVANAEALRQTFTWLRKVFPSLEKGIKKFGENFKDSSEEYRKAFKEKMPAAMKGFREGFKSAMKGAREGMKEAWAGAKEGMREATTNMNKNAKRVVTGMSSMVKSTAQFGVHAVSTTSRSLKAITGSTLKSMKEMGKAMGTFAMATAKALRGLAKTLWTVGGWVAKFFAPWLAVIAIGRIVADVMNSNAEATQRAAEAAEQFTTAQERMNTVLAKQLEARRSGTGDPVEVLGKKERLDQLLFPDEEFREQSFKHFANVTGRRPEDIYELATHDFGDATDVVQSYLTERGATDNRGWNWGGGTLAEHIEKLVRRNLHISTNSGGFWSSVASGIDRVHGIITDERRHFKNITGLEDADFDAIAQRLQEYQEATAIPRQIRENINHVFLDEFNRAREAGVDPIDLSNRLGLKSIDPLANADIAKGMYHEDLSNRDVLENYLKFTEGLDRELAETADQVNSFNDALKAADMGLMLTGRGIDHASMEFYNVATAAATAANAIASQTDAINAFIAATTNVFSAGTVVGLESALVNASHGLVEAILTGRDPYFNIDSLANVITQAETISAGVDENLFAQHPNIDETVLDTSPALLALSQQSIYDRAKAIFQKRGKWNADTEQQLTRTLNAIVPNSLDAETDLSIEQRDAFREYFGDDWANALANTLSGNVVSSVDSFSSELDRASGSVRDFTNSVEDGHIILDPGKTFDLNFGTAEVLQDNEVKDARITAPVPDFGGGGGSTEYKGPSISFNPENIFSVSDDERRQRDLDNFDPVEALKQARLEQAIRYRKKFDTSDELFAAIDMSSLSNFATGTVPVEKIRTIDIAQAEVFIEDATMMPAVGMYAEIMRQAGLSYIDVPGQRGETIRIELDVASSDGIDVTNSNVRGNRDDVAVTVTQRGNSGRFPPLSGPPLHGTSYWQNPGSQ